MFVLLFYDLAMTDNVLNNSYYWKMKTYIFYIVFCCRINVTLQLDTNQVRGFLFPAQAHLHWPSITRKCRVRFPLTQIGNLSVSIAAVKHDISGLFIVSQINIVVNYKSWHVLYHQRIWPILLYVNMSSNSCTQNL